MTSTTTSQTFYYVSALAGTGKTHSALRHAAQQVALGKKVAVATPSIALSAEWHRNAVALSLNVTLIDSSTQAAPWTALMNHLRTTPTSTGELLIITHKTLLTMAAEWPRAGDWHLIVDETFQPTEMSVPRLTTKHAIITDYLDVIALGSNSYLPVTVRHGFHGQAQAQMINKDEDGALAIANGVFRAVFDPHVDLFVDRNSWHQTVQNVSPRLLFGTLLKPSLLGGFRNVTVLAAMFEDTALYHAWKEQGVTWTPHKRITKALRYQTHGNGNLLTIEYLFERNWSKTFRDKTINKQLVYDQVLDIVEQRLGGQPYLYVPNLDEAEAASSKLSGQNISSVCHGLNTYSGTHRIAFLAALNPTSDTQRFQGQVVFTAGDKEAIRNACYHQSVYQAVMRTSLRNPDDKSPKHIVVMDRSAADYLAQFFPGATVLANPDTAGVKTTLGRPAIWDYKDQRRKVEQVRQKLIAEQNDVATETAWLSTFPTKLHAVGECVDGSVALIAEAYKSLMREPLGLDKAMNVHLSPTLFDPDKAEKTKRGKSNAFLISGIFLDNDGGTVTVDVFKEVLSDVRWIMTPTFTGSGRYRVYIPTSTPMTPQADQVVRKLLLQRFEDAGHPVAGSGFDTSKLNEASLFIRPGINPAGDTWLLDWFPDDIADPILNPLAMLEGVQGTDMRVFDALLPPETPKQVVVAGPVGGNRQARVDHALGEYQATCSGTGKRNNAFFVLALKLQRAGLARHEVEQHLRTVAAGEAKMVRRIKGVLTTIQSPKYAT
ncbi:hypothetical protein [Sphingomonas aerophila]|uniref:Helicase/UvrB N-terminal domain-containing protein n=1 Tax=Sphingomonas aerophila TaxID=1344948 RepID=A0A7W9EV10_9SPHN|nr:hypothetical protein [Sphingomonas aerophila]MBB5715834.1 hypothetical protein [Sphingomonas aerophila]